MLIGMMIVFGSLAYMVGVYGSKWLFGIDLMQSPYLLTDLVNNPQVLPAAKWMQVTLSTGLLLIPALVFPNALQESTFTFNRLAGMPQTKWFVFAIVLWLVSIPMVGALITWNQQVELPLQWQALEQQLKASETAANQMTKAFLQGDSMGTFWVNLFVMALLPSVAEELFFRGALQQLVMRVMPNMHLAIVLVAIVFSSFHMQFYGWVPRFVLGVFLGYVFACSQSMWPAIFFHFINNALSVTVLYFHLDERIYWMSETYVFPMVITILSAAGVMVLLGWLYRNRTLTTNAS